MRVFSVIRNKEDGTKYEQGHLIDGVVFDDETVVIRWRSETPSTAIYQCWSDFYKLHIESHPDYNSEIIWRKISEE